MRNVHGEKEFLPFSCMTPDDTVDILMIRTVGWTVSNGALLKGKQTWTPNVNGEHGDGKADILHRARDDKCNHVVTNWIPKGSSE